MNKEFYDKPLHTISNYITGLFLSSIYFAICNILLILFFIFTAITNEKINLMILFSSLIPLGPSLGALYSTISKIIREKDIYFSSYFWSYYKNNFVSYLKIWLVELITITTLFIDFKYFYINMPQKGIHIIFVLLIILSAIIGLYAFSINSRFEIKLKDLLIISLYYMVKKFPITILKIGFIVLAYYLFLHISMICIIFMPCIICVIFYYHDKSILKELEHKFIDSDSKEVN